jgi:hypothetical protein
MYNAFRAGLRSLGDDAARAATIKNAVDKNTDRIVETLRRTKTAEELAAVFPRILQEDANYVSKFNAAYPQPNYEGAEALAYGTGRKLGGVSQAVNNFTAPLGGVPGIAMQAAFMVPMVAPMFMGGGEQPQQQPAQPDPFEQEAILRARANQLRRMQQEQEAQQWGG